MAAGRAISSGLGQSLRRRPLLAAACPLILGILLHDLAPVAPWAWLGLAGGALVAAIARRRDGVVASACIAAALLLLGLTLAQAQRYRHPRDDIAAYTMDQPRLAELRLRLDHEVRLLSYPFATGRAIPPRQVTTARAIAVRTWDGWTPCDGRVLVQIAAPHARLRIGQTIQALGRLERPSAAMNPGQFDWAAYYREQRVLASLQVASAGNITVLEARRRSALDAARARVRALLARGFAMDRSLDHALLRALLLGDRDPELRDVQEQFRRTGTSHHLAVSGMHVAVLGGVVLLALRALRARPGVACAAAAAFAVFYGLVALPSPPVIRAVILAAFAGVGLAGGRAIEPLNLLGAALIGVLAYNPLDLYSAGFQLSFGTVFGLIVLTPRLIERVRGADPAPPPADALAAATRYADARLLHALAAAAVAWVVSMPLVAWHFNQLNPWAVPGSLLLGPLVLLSLVAGWLKVGLTLLWPGAAEAWAAGAGWAIGSMRQTVALLARLPGADVPLPAPPTALLVAFYVATLLALRPSAMPALRTALRLAPAALLLAMLGLPFVRADAGGSTLRLTVLGVGAGQCIVVEPPGGRVIMIDAGSATLSDPLRRCIAPFLRHAGRTAVDTLVISHANHDHFNAAAEVVEAYGVREVLVPAHFEAHLRDHPPGQALLRDLRRLDRPPRVLRPGDAIPLARDTRLEVLWPDPQRPMDPNNSSLVLRLVHAGRTVLLPGDVQEAGQRGLLDLGGLRADVLIAPHHGSAEAATAAFVEAVDPQWILSSNDRTLTGKQRRFDALVGATRPLLRTHDRGALRLQIDGDGTLRVDPFIP